MMVDDRLQAIDRYVLRRLLGVGGMGQVHLAYDTLLRRDVAIKLPLLHVDDLDRVRRRFHREGQAAASVNHPNVVPVLDSIEYDDRLAIVSRYVRGPTLHEYLVDHGGRLDPRVAVQIARRLADGLAAVHQKGVIHLDLKPSNILLEVVEASADQRTSGPQGGGGEPTLAIIEASVWDGQQRVCPQINDFGLADIVDDDAARSRSAVPVGTAAYMAPEQAGEGGGDRGDGHLFARRGALSNAHRRQSV